MPDSLLPPRLNKTILLVKYLFIIQSLSDQALEEAVEDLAGICRFYGDRPRPVNTPTPPAKCIKGRLRPAKVRPDIVLDNSP